MARRRTLIDRTRLPDGQELVLTSEGGYYDMTLAGTPLMSSAAHHSEERLAAEGCVGLLPRPGARVLIGGLGMGYTLRAALDRTSPTSKVVVVELVPAVVRWNRDLLADLAGRPLEDPRSRLVEGDIVAYLQSGPDPFDAILLDTDNGPDGFTVKRNARLYDAQGLARIRRTLRPGGRLVVWSAYQCPSFVQDLQRAGFEPSVVRARSRGHKGGSHRLYVGRRPEGDGESAPRARPQRGGAGRGARRKRRRS